MHNETTLSAPQTNCFDQMFPWSDPAPAQSIAPRPRTAPANVLFGEGSISQPAQGKSKRSAGSPNKATSLWGSEVSVAADKPTGRCRPTTATAVRASDTSLYGNTDATQKQSSKKLVSADTPAHGTSFSLFQWDEGQNQKNAAGPGKEAVVAAAPFDTNKQLWASQQQASPKVIAAAKKSTKKHFASSSENLLEWDESAAADTSSPLAPKHVSPVASDSLEPAVVEAEAQQAGGNMEENPSEVVNQLSFDSLAVADEPAGAQAETTSGSVEPPVSDTVAKLDSTAVAETASVVSDAGTSVQDEAPTDLSSTPVVTTSLFGPTSPEKTTPQRQSRKKTVRPKESGFSVLSWDGGSD